MKALANAEIVLLSLASVGESVRGSAKLLGISSGSVAQHLNRAILKLQVSSKVEAIAKAESLGIIETQNPSMVSAAVRRSLGLPGSKPAKARFASIREAMQIEAEKAKLR